MTTATTFTQSVKLRFSKDNLSRLEVDELHEVAQKLKRELEMMSIEKVWISKFLSENTMKSEPIYEPKKRVTFGSMRFSSRSSYHTNLSQSSSAARKLNNLQFVSVTVKSEICQREVLKIEHEIKQFQKCYGADMKVAHTDTEELEISVKEFANSRGEAEHFKADQTTNSIDSKIKSKVFLTFLKNLTKTSAISIDSIRLKSGTLKTECLKHKHQMRKREEQSNFLLPVDFDLAVFEKKRFQGMESDKQNYLNDLKTDERALSLTINRVKNRLLAQKLELKKVEAQTNLREQAALQLQKELQNSKEDVKKLEHSVDDLDRLTSIYETPSVDNYIEKIMQREKLRKRNKSTKRKNDVMKIVLKNLKNRHRL